MLEYWTGIYLLNTNSDTRSLDPNDACPINIAISDALWAIHIGSSIMSKLCLGSAAEVDPETNYNKVYVLPFLIMRGMQMKRPVKIGLYITFGLGGIDLVASSLMRFVWFRPGADDLRIANLGEQLPTHCLLFIVIRFFCSSKANSENFTLQLRFVLRNRQLHLPDGCLPTITATLPGHDEIDGRLGAVIETDQVVGGVVGGFQTAGTVLEELPPVEAAAVAAVAHISKGSSHAAGQYGYS